MPFVHVYISLNHLATKLHQDTLRSIEYHKSKKIAIRDGIRHSNFNEVEVEVKVEEKKMRRG
jgi:hypothetical protein